MMVSFKRRIICAAFALTIALSSVTSYAVNYESGINSKKSEINEAEDKLDTLQGIISKKESELKKLSDEMEKLYDEKTSKMTEKDVAIEELTFLKESIETFAEEIALLEQEHDELEKEFLERSRIMYQSSSSFDLINLFFSSNNIFEFMGKLDAHNKMIEEDKDLMQALKDNEEELAKKKATQEILSENQEILIAQIEKAIQEINDQQEINDSEYNELTKVLSDLQNQEKSYNNKIDSLSSELNKLEKEYAAALKAEEEEKAREAQRKLEEAKKKAEEANQGNPSIDISNVNFCVPVAYYYKITSPFGYRTHPINKTWSLHTGVDLGSPKGTKIYAAQAGTVKLAGTNGGFGKCVIIDHGNGLRTLYGHCDELYVVAEQVVSRGQTIAAVGKTGSATGYHLHFEVQYNKSPVQPLNYIKL